MRALVLSGGGVLGAYEVGALRKWMHDDGVDYDVMTGISVGAINTGFMAQYAKGTPQATQQALETLWKACNDAKIKQAWCGFRLLSKLWSYFAFIPALWHDSVYDSTPLQAWIDQAIDPKKINASGRILRVVSVCWDTSESKVGAETDPQIAEWVKASCAYPCMLSAITINGVQWTDGGLRSQTPLWEAIAAGADEIDVIMTSNPNYPCPWTSKGQTTLSRLARALGIFSDQIMRSDLAICGLKNDLADLKPQYKKVTLRILEPSAPLVGDLTFDPSIIATLMAQGYSDACKLG